ncbi:Protein of uncharacterised function (DUF3170) [Enterobacter hormaechei]|nr:Protein of uncharacterised function (DUF3170) [Enterobacter hormaechei]
MWLLVFRKVDGDKRLLAAEQFIGQRQGGFGLAGAARPHKQEHALRAVLRRQTGFAGAQALRNGIESTVLTDNAFRQTVLKAQQFRLLVLHQGRERYARPVGDNGGDGTRVHIQPQQRCILLHGSKLHLKVRNLSLAGDIRAAGKQFLRQRQLLAVPGFPFVELQNDGDFFLSDGSQTLAVGGITHRDILQQRLLLHSKGRELRFHAGQRLRHRIQAHTDTGRGGIQQIHRLVRKLASGQIASGERDGGFNRFIGNMHAMMLRVA